MTNYKDIATKYASAGLKVIPFWNQSDGSKRFPSDYSKYREAQSQADIDSLFSRDCDGICMLCTDGIEAIDIDKKHDPKGTIINDLITAIEDFGVNVNAVVQSTKSGGCHLIYRCEKPDGNRKLAARDGCKEAMIETRGNGGLLFIHPTPGYLFQTGDVFSIPRISQATRNELINVCLHLDERRPIDGSSHTQQATDKSGNITPWDDYNQRTNILDLVKLYGWTVLATRGDYVRLNRPNAKHSRGVDASVIISKNVFYPFTSSEVFSPNKGYTPHAFYTMSQFGGNFKASASALYQEGYGSRNTGQGQIQEKAVRVHDEQKAESPDLIGFVESTRFVFGKRVEEPGPMLVYSEKKDFRIAGRGMIGLFTGHEKSGKSFVLSCIAAAALSGLECLNFRLDLDGGKMLWFDTEQSGYFFHKTQERIYNLSGIDREAPNYSAYHLRRLTAPQRMEAIEHYIYNTPNVSCVVIDGLVDLITDYNDLKATQEYVGRLMKWTDEKQLLLMGVLHLNKGDGKVRGHAGSELKNKCDFGINTAKDESGFFTITNPTSRYAQFPQLDFSRGENGFPQYKSFFKETFGSGKPNTTSDDYTVPKSARPLADKDIPF